MKNDGQNNNTFQEICGYATTPDPSVPGSLLVTFPTSEFHITNVAFKDCSFKNVMQVGAGVNNLCNNM